MGRMSVILAAGLSMAAWAASAHAVPAFSGAEGWGAITPGGRGGQVIHVTNLNDSGPGSFREAVTASGPRTVVFDVAGRIDLLSEISITEPFLTIAGQTAPGDGITISGETVSMDTHDVIVRYMRFRRGTTAREDDSFGPDRTPGNMIIDHVSASWGYDENISVYRNKNEAGNVLPTHNVTIQWTISSEALNEPSADHPFGHAFGSTLGGKGVNFHHNLWASNTGRNPSLSFSHFIDFRNNVIFNWQHRSMDGAGPEAHVNVINNYYKPGPATGKANNATENHIPALKVRIVEPEIRQGVFPGGVGWWYVDGNIVEGYPEVTADNWEGESEVAPGVFARGVQFEQAFPVDWARVTTPHYDLSSPGPYPFAFPDPRDPYDAIIPPLPTIATQSAAEAFQSVLAGAGASLVRDAVDVRVIETVATGNATAGPDGDGIVHTIDQVGGYPVIPYVERGPDFDVDQDGMGDAWERDHGLDPTDAADRNGDFDDDGFTNLEEYLNDLGAFPAVEDVVWDGGNGRYALIENWNIAFQPSRFDTAVIRNGTATVDAVGQHAGTLKLGTQPGDDATLHVASGRLEVADELVIGADDGATAALELTGGALVAPLLSKGENGQFSFTGGKLHAAEVAFDLENDGGTVAPGTSTGSTTIHGEFVTNSGALDIELASSAAFDTVIVHGDVTLGGALSVLLLDGFTPGNQEQFAVLTGQTVTGTFENLSPQGRVEVANADASFLVTIGDGQVVLSDFLAGLPGDFNNDGVVDGGDYVRWRNHLGDADESALHHRGDGGDVGIGDYGVWKANYGQPSGGAGGFANVPEPCALAALAIGIALVSCRRFAARVGR